MFFHYLPQPPPHFSLMATSPLEGFCAVPGLAQALLWRVGGEKGSPATWLLPQAHTGSRQEEWQD